MKTWPKLHKITSTGALQSWEVWADGDKLYTRWGQVDGVLQESVPTIALPKNVGRANETTGEQQAILEAEALWTKKQKKDYVLDASPKAGATSDLVAGGILPMLAHKFSEHGDRIVYPCYVQPKLDGTRMLGEAKTSKSLLWSRTRGAINSLNHIQNAIDSLMAPGIWLDGEAYCHAYHDNFEDLMHFIRQSEPIAGNDVVEYHIYDIAGPGTFAERLARRDKLLTNAPKCLVSVETRLVQNEDELMVAFEDYLDQKYEGAIVRNAKGLYVNKRSYDLQKLKKFIDEEFEIVGVNEGRGKLAGHGIFVCRLPNGGTVDAKLKGSTDELRKYFEHAEKYVGKKLTIKFQGWTKYGSLRFPVAWRIRDDI